MSSQLWLERVKRYKIVEPQLSGEAYRLEPNNNNNRKHRGIGGLPHGPIESPSTSYGSVVKALLGVTDNFNGRSNTAYSLRLSTILLA